MWVRPAGKAGSTIEEDSSTAAARSLAPRAALASMNHSAASTATR